MAALFSVIIPVYKAEAYLPQCVDSVLAQTYPDFELILADDGSPDGCPAICDAYAEKDSRVTVLHLVNSGVVRARKAALTRATGEYICFVDADDYVKRDWLETVRRHMVEHNSPDMLLYGYTRDEDDGRSLTERHLDAAPGFYHKARLETEFYPYMLYDRRKRFFNPMVPGFLWMKIGRRDLYTAHYIQNEDIRLLEDIVMIYECMYHAESIYVGGECPYYYRVHGGATQSKYHPDYLPQMKLCVDYLRAHLGGRDTAIDGQINAFAAARVISAVTHDLRHGKGVLSTARHIRHDLRETDILNGLDTTGLPLHIWVYIALLRWGLCLPTAMLAAAQLRLTEGKNIRARM